MLHLAECKDEPSLQIADIAEQANVPRKFLEQILLDLKKRGLVHSTGPVVSIQRCDRRHPAREGRVSSHHLL